MLFMEGTFPSFITAAPLCCQIRSRSRDWHINTILQFRLVMSAMAVCLLTVAASPGAIAEEDNTVLTAEILAATAVHNPAFGISLVAVPPASIVAEGVVFTANILQKRIKAVLNVPGPVYRLPAESECTYEFTLPQSRFPFSDLFGFLKVSTFDGSANPVTGIPDDWGALGTPTLFHQNAEVILSASNAYITPSFESQTVSLPAGKHIIRWRADTLIDPVFDVGVPAALLATSIYSYMKAPAYQAALDADAAKAVSELSAFKKAVYKLLQPKNIDKFKRGATFVAAGADYVSATETVSVSHEREQEFTVYDVLDPQITVTTPNIVMEATDFGGVLYNRVRDQLLADVQASDPCDRLVSLGHDIPPLIPLGDTLVTWTATDLGPNAQGVSNVVTANQTITVNDTQAPIMVPPPGKVLEVAAGIPSLSAEAVDLGAPMVVDLADPMPLIANNAPGDFPVDSRTPVTWSATDHGYPSPNTSEADQWITVKLAGTNTAPTVTDQSGNTLTSQPIDFVLTGIDTDLLDGRVDPLSFEIIDRPGNGEFIAPLYPFFIEDYRTNPAGPYGDAFYLSGNKVNWLYDNVCKNPGSGPDPDDDNVIDVDWVYSPQFVHVTDEGTVFMIDTYWKCQASDATGGGPRISKWDAQGNYLGQIAYSGTTDAFVLDQGGYLYTLNRTSGGSSTTLTLTQVRPNFDTDTSDPIGDSWRFDAASTPGDPVSNEQYSYARVDSILGLLYVNDRRRVFVFDVRDDLTDGIDEFNNGMAAQYLGALNDGNQVINTADSGSWGSSWTGFAMEVDSQGNLYVADTIAGRIHKFSPSYFDEQNNFVMGAYIGWMGRCETSTNNACDEEKQASKGYSCTDANCTVATVASVLVRSGDKQGQFSSPVYLALDPNDVLYVADYGNSRIQRFAPDGTFAGEAVSTGTGINQGDHPSFVLGNMGQPKSVSVNSSQFYVVDSDESFVNVFETSPFKEITDSSVKLSYVSNFDFHGAADTFAYRATDGLAGSNTGTVTVNVARNFRPPVTFSSGLNTEEDASLPLLLAADDPDGILGVDFNGLDTLSYTIVTPPAHGTLSGTDNNRSYQPDPDFYGADSFSFTVNDGMFDSEPAAVAITIAPVNDAPVVTDFSLPERVGEGFPVILNGDYEDDGAQQNHQATISWGDNTEDVTGGFVDPDGAGGDPPMLEGIKVMEPPLRAGKGKAIAQHTYTGTGPRTVLYCMSDEQGQDCKQKPLQVESLVNLGVRMNSDKAEIFNDSAVVEISVENELPAGLAGVTANQVVITQAPSDYLQVTGFTVQPGGCSNAGGRISCAVGNLVPGTTFTLAATVQRKAPVIFNVDEPLLVEVTTSSDSIQSVYSALTTIRIQADTTDGDGDGMTDVFEQSYDLNPGSSGDAVQDADGDGLTNLEEFNQMTDPKDPDTDGDGLGDSAELMHDTDPLLADTDEDGLSDGQEINHGLNPLDYNDAATDFDGDGLTNKEEILLGADVSDSDTDNDGAGDATDNCILAANADQLDTDGDGGGNACDADDDNDGIPDSVENAVGLNSLDPSDAVMDLDGDGLTNIDEYRSGTDIDNPDTDGDGVNDYLERAATTIIIILQGTD